MEKQNKTALLCLIFIFIFINLYSVEFDHIPFQGITKKIVTDHFIIVFPEKFTETAKKTASYSENIHKNLSPFMDWKPYRRTTIILTDHTDFPNGMANPFMRNTITLYMAPLDLETTLRDQHDPLYSLILHEYTHILHLDQIRGGAWFWRVLYGKLYHPHVNTFRWYIEGIAVMTESKDAAGGRLDSSYNDAIIRASALKGRIPSYDELVLPVSDWPHGQATYHYGAKFVEYIYETYGEEKFKEFIFDLSNDFWPFVLLFVMKFKKVYGKSLNELWKEWSEYEMQNAEQYKNENEIAENTKITDLEGALLSFDRGEDFFIISSSSYKNDNYIYKLNDSGEMQKIHLGYHRSVSITNNSEYIMYTQPIQRIGGFYYTDLFSLNLKNKIVKRLTWKKRINYVSFAKNSTMGIFVSHDGFGSKLYSCKFEDGKINNINEIIIPGEIEFIGEPDINDSGTKVVFSARIGSGKYRMFLLDLENNDVSILDNNIPGKHTKWVDDKTISFVGPDGITDSLYGLNLESREIYKYIKVTGCVLNGIVIQNKVYYLDYTTSGEELFSAVRNDSISSVDTSMYEIENQSNEISMLDDYEITNYSGLRYLYPSVWAILLYTMDSSAYFLSPNGNFSLPFIGPRFVLYNTLPQSRFSYMLGVNLHYLKLYPENDLNLSFNIPFFNISYDWRNWAGGIVNYAYGAGYDGFYKTTYNNRYPINFSNTLSIRSEYPLGNYGRLSWQLSSTHTFKEYDFFQFKLTNKFRFYEQLSYSLFKSRKKATRWDRGLMISIIAEQYPAYILDNIPSYIFRGQFSGRVPIGAGYFFGDIDGGFDLLLNNSFYASTELWKITESIIQSGISSLTQIEMKAFPMGYVDLPLGSVFVKSTAGFDITLIKKSLYWHFATLGFKEFYLRTYGEFLYLYNNEYGAFNERGILFDAVIELGLDLFLAYGNITSKFIWGGSIGYRVGDNHPSWSVFFYLNAQL